MRKRIERIAALLLAACLLCFILPAGSVRADVLIELDDSFWEKHMRECDYAYRSYIVNSPEGYAYLWESPVSSKQLEVLVNGTEIAGSWRYTDDAGEIWCIIEAEEFKNGKAEVSGWIKTSECLVIPDHISFFEAYGQEFTEYDASYDDIFKELETVTFWTYPCSGVVEEEGVSADWFRDSVAPAEAFDSCWRDPQGRMWGFVSYYYGRRNMWLCLDDPTGAALPRKDGSGAGVDEDVLPLNADIYPAVVIEQENSGDAESSEKVDTAGTDVLPQDAVIYPPTDNLPLVKNGVTGLTIAGVLAVVIITAVLIWALFVRKKEK